MILDSKKIPYTKLDVAADETLKAKMREVSGNPTALPPQLCNGEKYCGVRALIICVLIEKGEKRGRRERERDRKKKERGRRG